MIERVLIADKDESVSISIKKTLEELGVIHTDYVLDADEAISKIITGIKSGNPYDLLITDLHFEEGALPQQITNGIELMVAARRHQPELKVLVFSAENKASVLHSLYNEHQIDGFVRKARNDAKELKQGLEHVLGSRRYLPRNFLSLVNNKNTYEFTELDVTIILLLANGVSQKNIPAHLEEKNLRPSGLSSVEKRLKQIRTELEFTKNEQLVAFCKDMGII